MVNRVWSWSRPQQGAELLTPQDAYALWAPSYPPRPHNRLMAIEQAVVESRLPDLAGRDALDAVICHGTSFVVRWNGETLFTQEDTTFASGRIGLWTKADSVTAFDDLEAEVL